MTVYLGDKAVGVNTIVEKEVAKTKFGTTVDDFLGDVDADGNYVIPNKLIEVDFAGVKKIPSTGLWQRFSGARRLHFRADDLTYVDANAFERAFSVYSALKTDELYVSFNNLETLEKSYEFQYACSGRSSDTGTVEIVFPKLKTVKSNYCFYYAFNQVAISYFDSIFPALEEVSGGNAFSNAFRYYNGDVITVSKIKKITGGTGRYSATFYGFNHGYGVWNCPSATELTGYIWSVNSNMVGEIHFAAANREAIEACEGYDYKWGYDSATIYFDLMLDIVVNGKSYTRKHAIGGYTSWEDTDGNLVYTDATAEPAVGTVVYSDQGTTQVGTVSEAS